jgi:hypothetical protein
MVLKTHRSGHFAKLFPFFSLKADARSAVPRQNFVLPLDHWDHENLRTLNLDHSFFSLDQKRKKLDHKSYVRPGVFNLTCSVTRSGLRPGSGQRMACYVSVTASSASGGSCNMRISSRPTSTIARPHAAALRVWKEHVLERVLPSPFVKTRASADDRAP